MSAVQYDELWDGKLEECGRALRAEAADMGLVITESEAVRLTRIALLTEKRVEAEHKSGSRPTVEDPDGGWLQA